MRNKQNKMTREEIDLARTDIETTGDLLARALKLSGLLTTLFRRQGISLIVVGGSAVEFYTEGSYMSGDIDFCRRSIKAPTPRQIHDILVPLGGKCIGRNWQVCGLFVDILGIVEIETAKEFTEVETPYGVVKMIPPELALVERVLFAMDSQECVASARQMMASALSRPDFDWQEAERLADLPDFNILKELRALRDEMAR